MIARETKVGLLVASSFVCLVGIVLVSKLMRADTPAPDAGGATAAPAASSKPSPMASAAGAPARNAKPAKAGPIKTQPAEKSSAVVEVKPGIGTDPMILPAPAPPQVEKKKEPAEVIVPPTAAVIVEAGPKAPAVLPSEKEIKVEKTEPVVKNEKENASHKEPDVNKILVEQKKKKDKVLPASTGDGGTEKKVEPRTNPLLDLVKSPAPREKKEEKPLTGGEPKNDLAKTEGAKPVVPAPALVEPPPPAPKVDPAILPIAGKTGPESEKKTPVIVAGDPAKLETTIPVPASGGSTESPKLLPIPGKTPVADSRRVPVSPASVAGIPATVESFDYWTHTTGQADTFASISEKYYKSDKYGPALREFNQKHPLAARTLQHDPPEPGQKVYVPDLAYLEQHHGAANAGSAAVVAVKPEVKIGLPVKEGSRPEPDNRMLADSSVVPVAGANAPAGGPTYTVKGAGERLYFIARDTLRDPNRWPEIYRLNPQIAPEQFIPVGTVLRLPGGAQASR